MSSTISNSTLTVTVSEQISLGGNTQEFQNQVLIPNINEIASRLVTVPSSTEVTLIQFATRVAAGTFVLDNVKYIRVTNKDDTNFVRLRAQNPNGQTFDVKIDAGQSFLMSNVKESANSAGIAFSAFVSAYNINAQADTAPVDVEFVVASI